MTEELAARGLGPVGSVDVPQDVRGEWLDPKFLEAQANVSPPPTTFNVSQAQGYVGYS